MQITLKDNYVESYATIGNIDGGIDVKDPKDMQHFESHSKAYFLNSSGELEFDERKWSEVNKENVKEHLRILRERECFPYINRGPLWYSTLTKDQYEELGKWYQAWLNVTETKEIPQKPEWLN